MLLMTVVTHVAGRLLIRIPVNRVQSAPQSETMTLHDCCWWQLHWLSCCVICIGSIIADVIRFQRSRYSKKVARAQFEGFRRHREGAVMHARVCGTIPHAHVVRAAVLLGGSMHATVCQKGRRSNLGSSWKRRGIDYIVNRAKAKPRKMHFYQVPDTCIICRNMYSCTECQVCCV